MGRDGKAVEEGVDAYCAGISRDACPYPVKTEEHEDWLRGWNECAEVELEQRSSPVDQDQCSPSQAGQYGEMSDRLSTRGLFRIPGDPSLVQVQFGPFCRPLTEEEYDAAGHEPPLEELPWIGDRADGSDDVGT